MREHVCKKLRVNSQLFGAPPPDCSAGMLRLLTACADARLTYQVAPTLVLHGTFSHILTHAHHHQAHLLLHSHHHMVNQCTKVQVKQLVHLFLIQMHLHRKQLCLLHSRIKHVPALRLPFVPMLKSFKVASLPLHLQTSQFFQELRLWHSSRLQLGRLIHPQVVGLIVLY